MDPDVFPTPIYSINICNNTEIIPIILTIIILKNEFLENYSRFLLNTKALNTFFSIYAVVNGLLMIISKNKKINPIMLLPGKISINVCKSVVGIITAFTALSLIVTMIDKISMITNEDGNDQEVIINGGMRCCLIQY